MSVTCVPKPLRRELIERADNRCEYFRIHASNTAFGCEIDPIISEKHTGRTESANLALSCFFCNRNKGSDIRSARPPEDTEIVRLFNPRTDVWAEHFAFDAERRIVPCVTIFPVTETKNLRFTVGD